MHYIKSSNRLNRITKRLIDLIISLTSFIIFLPLFVFISFAIKAEDGGTVIYRQKRVTINGKHFYILKFRSMRDDFDAQNRYEPAIADDPRITRIGRLMRPCHADELPQLINVLKGEMSLVGPRPEPVEYIEECSKSIPEFRQRLKVKAGITGMAQVYGDYYSSPEEKLKYDLMYIENQSIMLDFKLMFMTGEKVFLECLASNLKFNKML